MDAYLRNAQPVPEAPSAPGAAAPDPDAVPWRHKRPRLSDHFTEPRAAAPAVQGLAQGVGFGGGPAGGGAAAATAAGDACGWGRGGSRFGPGFRVCGAAGSPGRHPASDWHGIRAAGEVSALATAAAGRRRTSCAGCTACCGARHAACCRGAGAGAACRVCRVAAWLCSGAGHASRGCGTCAGAGPYRSWG